MNYIELQPLPLTEDGLLEDSRRIKEEKKREQKHFRHIDGIVNTYGGVEQYLIHIADSPTRKRELIEMFSGRPR